MRNCSYLLVRRVLIVLLVMIASGTGAAFSDSSSKTKLTLQAVFQERSYLVGEPVFIRTSLVNIGDEDIVVPYDKYGSQNTFAIVILDSKGREMPRLEYERLNLGPRALIVKKGESHSEVFDILERFPISESGLYSIHLTFRSEGKYYERAKKKKGFIKKTGWKGALKKTVGELKVELPRRKTDISALGLITPDPKLVPRQGQQKYPFLRAFSKASRRAKLLKEQPDSYYTGYARFYQALADLERYRGTTRTQFARSAIDHLEAIEQKEYPKLLQELILFHLIRSYQAIDPRAEKIRSLIGDLESKFPGSPYLADVDVRKAGKDRGNP